MSDDPKVCVNCHIMQPQYDAWQKASHHGVATCVDCHLPHGFVGKYLAKAENGFHHSKGVHAAELPRADPDHAKQRAHPPGELRATATATSSHEMLARRDAPRTTTSSCVHCHADVGHGARRAGPTLTDGPIAGRNHDENVPTRRRDSRSACWSDDRRRRRRHGRSASPRCSINIFERKSEAANPYVRLVEVDRGRPPTRRSGRRTGRTSTTPTCCTAQTTRTRFGGHGGSEALPEEKIERDPWLKRMFLRLCVLDRLPRPPRPRLHARRSGGRPSA